MKRIIAILLLISLMISLTACHSTCVKNGGDSPVFGVNNNADAPICDVNNGDNIAGADSVTSDDMLSASSPEEAITDIAVDVMKNVYKGDANVLVSPVSISLALGLTAGGMKGETYDQLERLLGRGISLSEMNRYYQEMTEKLDNSETVDINVANSVWIREGSVNVKDSYLQYADEVYDAEVYTEPFDNGTATKINRWISDETDGMIKKIINSIDSDTVMYLMNAMAFDAEWQREYRNTSDSFRFTNADGVEQTVTGMFSTEAKYLEDENTTGFVKNYKGGEYSFAVFLPDENVNIDDYVAELTGEKITNMLKSSQTVSVKTALPKFTYEYSEKLNDSLKTMGMTDAFTPGVADLTGIGDSTAGELYVGDVIHKTFIEVAEKGTKAAAVTMVEVDAESVAIPLANMKYVTVDRPFVFAIIDNTSRVPLFLGAVLSVE